MAQTIMTMDFFQSSWSHQNLKYCLACRMLDTSRVLHCLSNKRSANLQLAILKRLSKIIARLMQMYQLLGNLHFNNMTGRREDLCLCGSYH